MTTDDRTRAIAWFEKQSKCLAMPGAAKMFGLAVEALNAGKWIPVSERLPDQDGSYLVIDEYGNMFNSTFDGSCGDNGEFGEWNAIYDQHTLGYLDSEWNSYSGITHWRPLPDPPRTDDEA